MGSVRVLLTTIGYVVGCGLLIPGTYFFLPGGKDWYYKTGVELYIAACAFLFFSALVDYLFTLFQKQRPSFIKVMVDFFMLAGGLLFELASILYWPSFGLEPKIGTYVFRFGSFAYLCGSFTSTYQLFLYVPSSQLISEETMLLDVKEAGGDSINWFQQKKKKKITLDTWIWFSAVLSYILGAFCFIIGGVFSELEKNGFAESWMVGSCFFVLGACISFFQVVRTWQPKPSCFS